jgi:hypothetical protein
MTRPRISRNRIKNAIPGSGGVIAVIARRAGYSWWRTRDFIAADPELTAMLRAEEETVSDMAESVIISKIRDGDESAARWWLSRRRRGRFGDNVDVTSDGMPIVVNVRWRSYGDGDEAHRD